ncbi:hypothetical protein [Chryseobacterium nepalense]|uniref:CHAT domain-containing protein n=1 Tax=Chryseobacterium nepalense TaxID=1854498 RepID=A0ABY4K9T6_9FLAO|nr:hypothetical protein [Chryseobacterium nepalense]UPQ77081.1 hypothetical protein M0D58_05860 [Chryseobacterium nepalense]
MDDFYIIHALDETTSFLEVFKSEFPQNYHVFLPAEISKKEILELLKSIPDNSLILFLGHGHSTGLYGPEGIDFPQNIFIDSESGNVLFKEKKVILLSCNSNQFVTRLNTHKEILGFGNILSSMEQLRNEVENGARDNYGTLSKEDIDYFNAIYCTAIIKAIKETIPTSIYTLKSIKKIIEFFINKELNFLLKNKQITKEFASLLFSFRNDMVLKIAY